MCCVIGMYVLLHMLDSCSKIWRKYTENIKRGFQNEFTSNNDNFFSRFPVFGCLRRVICLPTPTKRLKCSDWCYPTVYWPLPYLFHLNFSGHCLWWALTSRSINILISERMYYILCSHKNVPDPGPIIVLPCLSFKSKSKKRNQTSLKIQNDTKLKPPRGWYKDKIMIFSFFQWLCLHVQESSPRCLTEAKGKGHCCSRLTSSSDLRTCAVFFQPCCTLSV